MLKKNQTQFQNNVRSVLKIEKIKNCFFNFYKLN